MADCKPVQQPATAVKAAVPLALAVAGGANAPVAQQVAQCSDYFLTFNPKTWFRPSK